MTRLYYALGFVLAINLLFFLVQTGVDEINPTGAQYYSVNGTILNDFDPDNTNIKEALPSGSSSVDPETGNFFTDIFTTIKQWTGLDYLLKIVNALPNFLKAVGLPDAFVWGIGAFWHGITIFLIVSFLFGGRG